LILDESLQYTEGINILNHKLVLSNLISEYAMFPILGVETVLYTTMNIYLLWIWYTHGQFGTIINKIMGIQRICGVFYSVGCLLDYFLHIYGEPISFISQPTLRSCWMIYYKLLVYNYHTSHLVLALLRFFCVKFPIEYHVRYGTFIGLLTY
jgi:hypothetical protein